MCPFSKREILFFFFCGIQQRNCVKSRDFRIFQKGNHFFLSSKFFFRTLWSLQGKFLSEKALKRFPFAQYPFGLLNILGIYYFQKLSFLPLKVSFHLIDFDLISLLKAEIFFSKKEIYFFFKKNLFFSILKNSDMRKVQKSLNFEIGLQ